MDDRRFYRGTVRGAQYSFVHVRIALDGTVHGTFICDDEMCVGLTETGKETGVDTMRCGETERHTETR